MWKSPNQLRTQVGQCRDKLCKWGFRDANLTLCDFGAPTVLAALVGVPSYLNNCSVEDLNSATDSGRMSNTLHKVNIVLKETFTQEEEPKYIKTLKIDAIARVVVTAKTKRNEYNIE